MSPATRFVPLSMVLGLIGPNLGGGAPPQEAANAPRRGTATLRLATPQYRLTPVAAGRHRIDVDGFARATVSGAPALPFTVLEIEVPPGATRESLRLQPEGLSARRIAGTHRLQEATAGVVDRRFPIAVLQEQDVARAAPADLFPKEPFVVLDVVSRGEEEQRRTYARVLYSPFQVSSASGELLMTTARSLKLAYEIVPPLASLLKCDRFDYIIVTTRAIRDASTRLADFVWHKESRGFSVRVVTEDDFDSLVGPYPNGRAERIRKWLQTHYKPMGIRYVLLIGNPDPDDPMYSHDIVGDIPMKQVWQSLAGEMVGGVPKNGFFWGDATDWYYSDLTGNWDVNGDGFYGVRPWLRPADVIKSPLPAGIPSAGFSARWTGTINIPSPGVVGIQLEHWPHGRVFVDDVLVIDHWAEGAPTKSSRRVDMDLDSGAHTVRVEYKQPGSHGHVRFGHVIGPTGFPAIGFAAEYFPNLTLSGTAQTVAAEDLSRNWENSDYASSGGVDLNGEVAVGRIPVFDEDIASLDKTLDRIMAFETGPVTGRNTVLLSMKPLDQDDPSTPAYDPRTPLYDLGEAIVRDHLQPAGLRPYRIYESTFGLSPPPEATPVSGLTVTTAWNSGVGAVFTVSHGSPRWTDHLDAARHIPPPVGSYPYVTADHPAIAAFIGCHVGWPYLPDCYPGCAYSRNATDDARSTLAASALREIAVAVIAATEVSTGGRGPFTPNQWRLYDEDLTYLYAREIANNQPVGEAMRRVNYTHFFMDVADKPNLYRQQLIHVLYGDPSVRLSTPCSLDNSPCVLGDMRAPWTVPGRDQPFIWENFVPKICQFVVDCPGCPPQGLCPFSATLDLPAAVALEVRDAGGRTIATSPRGTSHTLRFRYDPASRYRLVARDPQAAGPGSRQLVRGIKVKWLPPEP